MKFIELRKRKDGSIWAIDLFNEKYFIDLRRWYKVFTTEDNQGSVLHGEWSDIWYEEHELEELDWSKKVGFLEVNLKQDNIREPLNNFLWFILGAIFALLILFVFKIAS